MNGKYLWVTITLITIACNNPSSKNIENININNPNSNRLLPLQQRANQSPKNALIQQELFDYLDSAKLNALAIKHVNLLLKNDSLNHELWYLKGHFSERIKDTLSALQFYKYAITIYPTPKAFLSMANLLAEKKDSTAIAICNQIQSKYPSKEYLPDLLFIKGIYYSRKGNLNQATAFFNQCIYTNYRYLEAYMEKAFILYDKNKIQDALTIFATVLKLDPLYSDGYYWQAKCFEKMGKREAAIINYQKTLALDSTFTEATIAIHKLK